MSNFLTAVVSCALAVIQIVGIGDFALAQNNEDGSISAIFNEFVDLYPGNISTLIGSKKARRELAISKSQLHKIKMIHKNVYNRVIELQNVPYTIDLTADNPGQHYDSVEAEEKKLLSSCSQEVLAVLLPGQRVRFQQLFILKSLSGKKAFNMYSENSQFDKYVDVSPSEREDLDRKINELNAKFEKKSSELWLKYHSDVRESVSDRGLIVELNNLLGDPAPCQLSLW